MAQGEGWAGSVTQVADDRASLLPYCPSIFTNTLPGTKIPHPLAQGPWSLECVVEGLLVPPKPQRQRACRIPCQPQLFLSAPLLPYVGPLLSSDVTDLLFVDWLWA